MVARGVRFASVLAPSPPPAPHDCSWSLRASASLPSSLMLDLCLWSYSGRTPAAAVYGVNQTVKHLVWRPYPVDHRQLAPVGVEVEQGCGVAVVEVEASVDGFFGVVVSVNHIATANPAHPRSVQRRLRSGEVGAAVNAPPPRGQSGQHHLPRHLQVDGEVVVLR